MLLLFQIKKQQLSGESFWVKTNEEDFESLELFQELEKSFGTGRARNLELDSGPKLKLPKIKELKVLDAKSAQNICKLIHITLQTVAVNSDDCISMILAFVLLYYFQVHVYILHCSSSPGVSENAIS